MNGLKRESHIYYFVYYLIIYFYEEMDGYYKDFE